MNTSAPVLPRLYVPALTVARVCGLSLLDLENKYRPDDWGSPRDFTATRAAILYSAASLPRLADALTAAGQTDAALRLREWLFAGGGTTATPAAEPAGQLVAVVHEDPTPEVIAHQARSRRHRSDVEPSPFRDADL